MSLLPPAFLALSPLERDALCVLATSTRPASRSDWENKVRAVGLRASGSRGLYGEAFKAVVARLEKALLVGNDHGYFVPGGLVAAVLEEARQRGRLEALARPLAPRTEYGWYDAGQTIRFAVILRDANLLRRTVLYGSRSRRGEISPFVLALTLSAPESWIAQLPDGMRDEYLRDALHLATSRLDALGADVLAAASRSDDGEIRGRAAIARALSGDADGARATIPARAGLWEDGARAVVLLTLGHWEEALAAFARAATTKQGSRRTRGLPSYLAVFDLLLAASPAGHAADASSLPSRVEAAETTLVEWPCVSRSLSALAVFSATGRIEPLVPPWQRASWLDYLVWGLGSVWTDASEHVLDAKLFGPTLAAADGAGYLWVARQIRGLLQREPTAADVLAGLRSKSAPWELALEALRGAVAGSAVALAGGDAGQIVWTIDGLHAELDDFRLTARWVKKAGQAGAALSVERLRSEEALPLRPEDRPLVEALVAAKRFHSAGMLPLRTLLLAIGHPRLRAVSGAPLAIERGSPEVRVRATAQGARLECFPAAYRPSGIAVVAEPGRLVVFERTEAAARLGTILGDEGLQVPKEGLARAAETLAALAPHVAVRDADVLGKVIGARTEPADGRIRVQLFRAGTAFRTRLRVVPGSHEGPALRPGAEPAHVLIASAEGSRAVVRDLAEERARVARLVEGCPLFAALRIDGEDRIADDLETCLELLLELDALRGDEIVVEWPEGQPLRPPIQRDMRSLRVRVASDADWLAVEAELEVDEGRVVAFAELLERASSARGRFVPLADGDYLILTEKLRERVEALGRVHALRDKRGRTSPAMLPAVAQWADGTDLEIAKDLGERLDVLQRALDATPRVPRTLQAELRDYQRDGFMFLARRASSGLGACLADDMGLGKTVQALALLAARAKLGPALVVAPMSVCRNWEDEARRFTPSLTFHRLSAAPDRAASIAGLQNGDVLLVSYGLLAACAEPLAARRFATAVFDEAHALKNPDTRRAAAARGISADALVGLTGTPLENHLGELHSLFDVLAPGLLGTRDKFERAFAAPIARGDKAASGHLRALVRPFLLRRTKAQVLDELPEKTEMTRIIAPGDAERDFYEALRRRAVARALDAPESNGSQARIRILAEITKLRRAAIDPRLVGGDDAPAGGKLDVLAELVGELREEGHRALVFSQFLEVLDRAGERLRSEGARCVRLDGSMDAAARAAAVEVFQSGQADVFLLSLRAGGVGMNLTAADYVIHLDPWWNPAVEDQATDRAHRIGQTRPVTVVRLVTEGTIEEKVLRLHASKRALYADALGGFDVAKRLDVAALADLLHSRVEPRLAGSTDETLHRS
jgi:superfamily II DNA or RNA helicase